MARRFALVAVAVLALLAYGAPAGAHTGFRPGTAGIGDPYFPLSGNGGYDVKHYGLDLRYTPADDRLSGVAVITARATQDLSRFNFDFHGLSVRSVTVDDRMARWTRSGDELTVTPARGLRSGTTFIVVARYDGVPGLVTNESLGDGGVFHTDDGMVIVGQPFAASTWFPVNDHPRDKAAYTVRVTVPKGLEAVSNGQLISHTTQGPWTTWLWDERAPMASYLATATVGEFRTTSYTKNGLKFFDAIDPDLFVRPPARTGTHLAISGVGEPSYKRLTRTIAVPATGGRMTFWVSRETESDWDYFFVEARTAGAGDWTTLPDANGHTSTDTGNLCDYAPDVHPFLVRYLNCSSTGTASWNAATGVSDGYEQWSIDLSKYAGKSVELSLSYENDPSYSPPGVFVDDIAVSTGQGTTSFEPDGNQLDGWTPTGPPPGSEPNPSPWTVGTVADEPTTTGELAARSLAREPEIIRFESGLFGPYPFNAAGGIVDDVAGLGFALENQTRPIYAREFFTDPEQGDSVVVHELAHQWYGDSLALTNWRDIWLNEGFATYAEWLWSEHEGRDTVQEIFDGTYSGIPAGDPFWTLRIGDPGPDNLFDGAVYDRGAMTLHALRQRIGDPTFFRLLKQWATTNAGGNVTTPQFIALAERLSGRQLDDLFTAWLYTPSKPAAAVTAVSSVTLDFKR
ncbi:M1 family metallopeptidase [Paractinoplanes atraurantiacus]|uniref:Immune inhibitor A peptidase M6 n=1 Tax=Paractinoplanes atraurantiacus TaxID=1036182 RepID=A0A285HP17_9ACTN|nr:M1 family metallopeptidase [Actinoplanes atraurantiacus]SNY37478.1 Immune inhibitor A peptidase M6 [Actinoplanes atraurantiacus]